MKVYAPLEKMLNRLAYCAIIEDGFVDVCEAAGVNWTWPKSVAGDAVAEFSELRDTIGAQKAREKMRGVVRLLEAQVDSLSAIPSDLDLLRDEYRALAKVQHAIDAAHAVLKEPESFERIFKQFEVFEGEGVVTRDFDQLKQTYALVKAEIAEKGPRVVIPGFELTSELIGGFNPKRVTLLLAQSGFGKTNLAMNLALAAADRMAVGYMNLEMSFEDIAARMAVIRSGKGWIEHFENRISSDDLGRSTRHEIRFSDGTELHAETILAWAKAFKRQAPTFGLLIIDYDQKILVDTSPDAPEWKALHVAMRKLEETAKRLDIHVVLVAQFNRQGELASSWRMKNTAHSVITFREHNGGAIIENSIKARHAKYPCAVSVRYDKTRARVDEEKAFGIWDLKEETPEQTKKKTAKEFSEMMSRRYDPHD